MPPARVLRLALAVVMALALVPTTAAGAQEEAEGALLLIMDASGSMEATDADGVRLIDGAKDALRGVVDALPDGTNVGLRVYGHREPNTDEERGCQDTELVSPVQPLDRDAMRAAIDGFEPSGFTPIGLSLQEAAGDLPPEGPRTIILVSDGEDTCSPPDPCDVAADLRRDGVDLVIETVGFALGDNEVARQQLACIAEAGGGEFRDIATAAELAEQLEVVSVREARRYQQDGIPVEGTTVPLDAPDITVNEKHTDTILHDEFLYYRVDVSNVRGEITAVVVRGPNDAGEGGPTLWAGWTDRSTDWFGGGTPTYSESSEAADAVVETRAVDVTEVDEVYLQLELRRRFSSEGEYPVEITVVAEDVEEPADAEPTEQESEAEEEPVVDDETGEPEEPDPSEAAAAEAGAGVPAWAVAVIALLTLLVLVLGALVVMMMRRQSPSGTPPPT
ncbi:MAG TPA: VWA domain-containing protein [Egicoccus sp.]|nr:VWA domain-containing protein [Egicoccus sp.]HSK22125.1 VWA domain-containing protein [Egicoccus sp.]